MYTCVYQVVLFIQNNALFLCLSPNLTDLLIFFEFIISDEENILRNSPLCSFLIPPFTASLVGPNAFSNMLFTHTILFVYSLNSTI